MSPSNLFALNDYIIFVIAEKYFNETRKWAEHSHKFYGTNEKWHIANFIKDVWRYNMCEFLKKYNKLPPFFSIFASGLFDHLYFKLFYNLRKCIECEYSLNFREKSQFVEAKIAQFITHLWENNSYQAKLSFTIMWIACVFSSLTNDIAYFFSEYSFCIPI